MGGASAENECKVFLSVGKLAVMLNEAKTSRPRLRPKLRGRGQDYEVEAEAKHNYEESTK